MANRPTSFKQLDVTRAVKGAQAAGLEVGSFKVDPRTGEIVVFVASQSVDKSGNPWDGLLKP